MATGRLRMAGPCEPDRAPRRRDGGGRFPAPGRFVVHAAPAALQGGQSGVHPGAVYEAARSSVPDAAEAVFFGGNGFRVIGTIAALGQDLGRPVLSANQVPLWAALGAARLPGGSVEGYGRIFSNLRARRSSRPGEAEGVASHRRRQRDHVPVLHVVRSKSGCGDDLELTESSTRIDRQPVKLAEITRVAEEIADVTCSRPQLLCLP